MGSRPRALNARAMIDGFAARLPKAELHLHIEGTLEPELLFTLAERNKLAAPFSDVAALRAAYAFTDLQSFLNVYFACSAVLRTEQDYYDLTDAYLRRARVAGVVHAEIFFDPQSHIARGVPLEVVIEGITAALRASEARYGITTLLIMCFLRDRSVDEANQVLEGALRYGERIVAVGLDSSETNFPPRLFADVFARARAEGWRAVAHAGEEGPPAYVTEALDVLGVERIDHGVRSLEDPVLVARLRDERIPLTVCPLSNVRLRVVARLEDHPLRRMLEGGLCATLNSDDPAYFGGYVDDNFAQTARALELERETLVGLARNSFEAAFLEAHVRRRYLERLDAFVKSEA
jgi:adenosine deaminase